jgi:predicted Zn-dependent peptidase
MNYLKRFYLLLILSLISAFAVAEPFEETLVKSLKEIGDKVTEVKLSNGIPVMIYPRGEAPVFSGVIGVRVGGVDELPGHTGISHMFEHMAFKGSTTIGTKNYEREKVLLEEEELLRKKQIAGEMSDEDKNKLSAIEAELQTIWVPNAYGKEIALRGGEDLNASTTKELTRYWVNLPRPGFEYWCSLEADRLIHPVLRQFYQERDVVMEERRMRSDDDPTGKLYEALLLTAYKVHPYRNPVIGYDSDLKKLTASDVEEFRKRFYNAGNIAISIAGAVSNQDIYILEKYFGKIPKAAKIERNYPQEPPQTSEQRATVYNPTSPLLAVAYHKPVYPDRDDPPLSLLEEILAGNKVSPLIESLVKKKMFAQSIDVFEEPGNAQPNLLIFWITPQSPHQSEEVLSAFDSEVEKFIARGPTPEEMNVAKRSFAVQQLGEIDSNQSFAMNLVTTKLLYGDWHASLQWLQDVMKVTSEDILRVAKQYLQKKNRTVAILEQK